LDEHIYVYNFDKLGLISRFETYGNVRGVMALSPSPTDAVLVCPGSNRGSLRIENISTPRSLHFPVNDSGVACCGINNDGTLCAVASERGTLIRVFDTSRPRGITHELRRGTTPAEIFSINFSPDSKFLCCSSDRGTIHVWCLDAKGSPKRADGSDSEKDHSVEGAKKKAANNRKSALSMFGGVAKYFTSEWSFAWWDGPDMPSIAAFGPKSDVIFVVCADLNLYKLHLDTVKAGPLTLNTGGSA